ncbi:MAG: DUF2382 domain-containing protein [Sphingosinicella sp.]|nr:DUF2382 domain-containing protein [Sphingosinicella sp.]
MSRTVTALYDTRAEAEAACERLNAGVDVEGRAKIVDKSSGDSSHFSNMPNEDRHAFGEGLNRGGFMLCAEVDGDEDADKIIALLEDTGSVDLDERQDAWRNEGWQPYAAGSTTGMEAGGSTLGRGENVAEEQLFAGKREVNRGGARVRSYVQETPETVGSARRTEVEVDEHSAAGDRSAMGFGRDAGASNESQTESSFERTDRDRGA